MNYGLNELKQMCFDKMIVGCLNNNPSNAFYSHMGGKLLGTRDFTKTNDIIKENVYYFKNI